MRRAWLPAALLALAACVVPKPAGQEKVSQGPGGITVYERRTFKLVRTPDQDLEMALEGMLSESHEAALKRVGGPDAAEVGFTYSLAPKGAVYPFSEIEVSCIMQNRYMRSRGPELCGEFFGGLEARIKKALQDRQ